MFPDEDYENSLFEGFRRIHPAPETAARAVERTRLALLRDARAAALPRAGVANWVPSLASAAALVGVLILLIALRKNHPADDNDVAQSTPHSHPGMTSLPAAPKWVSSIQVLVAANRPILVANGGDEPLHLGASVPKQRVGSALHVWDWSRSPFSRIIPGVEFSMGAHAAISPDGHWLVFASGTIVDLSNGDQTTIDLGDETYEFDGAIYTRIGAMKFSPDGGRLALEVTHLDESRPGVIEREVIQIVQFPSGDSLCEFPADKSRMDTIAFSADGREIVSISKENQLVRREVVTGTIVRQYEPVLESAALSIALSPDDRLMATSLSSGDLVVWDTHAGQVVHRIDFAELNSRGGNIAFGGVRFAPDSRYLAAEYWDYVFIVDASVGTIAAELRDRLFHHFQWSRDRKVLTGLTAASGRESPDGNYDEIYPAVHEWDWRGGRKVRSLDRQNPVE